MCFSAVFNRKWRLFVEAPGRPPPAGGENVEFRADLLHICREHGMMDSIKEGVDRYDRLRYRESRAEQSRVRDNSALFHAQKLIIYEKRRFNDTG